ncbi:hypothetical protein C5167_003565 [Papaver somniferum]|uniref:Uncharacterized protein n=1 Tax=Papaver somniferum TaxID=3469 RepID=A0A4Y7L3Y7_PAPSO|nr:hypothetical protein C5167_003565 [Papaver somniferum]
MLFNFKDEILDEMPLPSKFMFIQRVPLLKWFCWFPRQILVMLNSGTYGALQEIEDSKISSFRLVVAEEFTSSRTVDLDSINSGAHVCGVERGDFEDDDDSEYEEEEVGPEIEANEEPICISFLRGRFGAAPVNVIMTSFAASAQCNVGGLH